MVINIVGNDIRRGGEKIGWIEGNDVYNDQGMKIGYFSGNDVYNKSGTKVGYIKGDKFYRSDGYEIDLSKLNQEVSGGQLSPLGRAAVKVLLEK